MEGTKNDYWLLALNPWGCPWRSGRPTPLAARRRPGWIPAATKQGYRTTIKKLMLVVVVMFFRRNHAPALRNGATHVLELHRSVMNVKLSPQHVVDARQHTVAGRGRKIFN